MTKLQFLLALHDKLASLPQKEVEERLNFYSEMIEDRMEDGLSEEQAVAAVGATDEIAAQIAAEIPLTKKLLQWQWNLMKMPLWRFSKVLKQNMKNSKVL